MEDLNGQRRGLRRSPSEPNTAAPGTILGTVPAQ
jgi:hypothetical protein